MPAPDTATIARTVCLAVEGKGMITVVVQVPAGLEHVQSVILADAMRTAIAGTLGA